MLTPCRISSISKDYLDTVFYRKMTRGLYFKHFDEIMPVGTYRAEILSSKLVDHFLPSLFHRGSRGNHHEIEWAYNFLDGDTDSSIWMFKLYNAGAVGVFVGQFAEKIPKRVTFAKGLIVGGNPDS